MKLLSSKKYFLSLLFLAGLLISVFVAINLAGNRQDIRNRASGESSLLYLEPSSYQFDVGETKQYDLKLKLENRPDGEKLSYFKTEISFDSSFIKIAEGQTIDTSFSGLDKQITLFGPIESEEQGRIVIELGLISSGSGPPSNQLITIARIPFKSLQPTAGTKTLTIGKTQIVNSQAQMIPVDVSGASYIANEGVTGTPTPIPDGSTPTPTPTVTGDPECLLAYGGVCRSDCHQDENQIQAGCFPDTVCCKKQTSPTSVSLYLDPAEATFDKGESKVYNLMAKFTNGSAQEKLNYFKATVSFANTYLAIPSGVYIDTSPSGFDRIFRVDGPIASNQAGKIIIELGSSVRGTGPGTDKLLTIAKITFAGMAKTPSLQSLVIEEPQIVNQYELQLPTVVTAATYNVTDDTDSRYLVDIGEKQSLTIQVHGDSRDEVFVKFKVDVLAEKKPEIKATLKVVDLEDQLNSGIAATTVCVQTEGQYVYTEIPLVPDEVQTVRTDEDNNMVYTYIPKAGSSFRSYVGGDNWIAITEDGWLPLVGLTSGKRYSLSVKGEKHRDMKMVDNFILNTGKNDSQTFDWTDNYLEVGDLSDPNNALKQDCTVNSVDISLVVSRIGKTDDDNTYIGDVNYDWVINGHDVSQIVHTLSTRPDDDL